VMEATMLREAVGVPTMPGIDGKPIDAETLQGAALAPLALIGVEVIPTKEWVSGPAEARSLFVAVHHWEASAHSSAHSHCATRRKHNGSTEHSVDSGRSNHGLGRGGQDEWLRQPHPRDHAD